ncbi:hypothetical protein N8Z24_00710 [bacterium]|nr:hypothetical protein [bacterium]
MIIRPKANSPSTLDFIELTRTNSNRYIYVIFQENDGTPIDIVEEMTADNQPKGAVDLEVTDLDGVVLHEESYYPPSESVVSDRRITHPATGKYQIQWGTGTNETVNAQTLLFNWRIRKDIDTEDYYRTQVVEVVSPRTLSLLPKFRLMLDKSIKVLDPENYCALGYSDSQLIAYLQMGLSYISGRQPYPSWANLDQFPLDRGLNILMKCGLYEGLLSQLVFSIDVDVPAFNIEGHSFVLTHAPIIKSLRDSMTGELEKTVREFKLHYVNSGSISFEFRIGYAFYQTVMSAPPGSIFRNSIAVTP